MSLTFPLIGSRFAPALRRQFREGLTSRRLPSLAAAAGVSLLAVLAHSTPVQAQTTLLNVSYDPPRELDREVNEQFSADWVAKGNPEPKIETSHGGSGASSSS